MSRVVLQLDGGAREQIRDGFAGAWTGKDGVAHASSLHNCFTDASWFAPLLILEAAASGPAVSVTLAPTDDSNGSGNPDNDGNRDIPVEIQFSDYRPVNGALVPFHIQKFIQHSPLLDLEGTAASMNSGLAASAFALPAIAPGASSADLRC